MSRTSFRVKTTLMSNLLRRVLKQSDSEAYLWARRAANKGLSKAEYAVGCVEVSHMFALQYR